MSEPRIIKRYANRKLYDTQQSRYVTLEQIAEMIRAQEDVRIVDNNSKEDLTAMTLAQIIFEEEKKKSYVPLNTLRHMIQSGGESIQQFASQAGEKVRAVFRRDKDGKEEEVPAAEAEASHNSMREFLERSQHSFDEWQKRVDDRIRHAIESISPLSSLEKEVKALAQKLAELEKRLDERD